MTTQKQIAQVLDRAASRADMIDANPATRKQIWFLAGLIARSRDPDGELSAWRLDSNAVLTVRRASSEIDSFLAAEKHAA